MLSSPTVDVYVGSDKRHWRLHRDFLSFHSEYLKQELQAFPLESTPTENHDAADSSLRLDLPDDDPTGFELLVKWLYQGKIDDVSNILDGNDKYEYAVACQHLHQLCERFEMTSLKIIAMDQYRKGLHQAGLVPDAAEINTIYRQSTDDSVFRKLMVAIAARQIMDPESDVNADAYTPCFEANPRFAIDLVNAIKAGVGGFLLDDPTENNDCTFHDHSDGPTCSNKGKKRSPLMITRPGPRHVLSLASSSAATARPLHGTSPPRSPHLAGFDHAAFNDIDDTGYESSDTTYKSARSEAGTVTSPSEVRVTWRAGKILNSPASGRKPPRKLATSSDTGVKRVAGEKQIESRGSTGMGDTYARADASLSAAKEDAGRAEQASSEADAESQV